MSFFAKYTERMMFLIILTGVKLEMGIFVIAHPLAAFPASLSPISYLPHFPR